MILKASSLKDTRRGPPKSMAPSPRSTYNNQIILLLDVVVSFNPLTPMVANMQLFDLTLCEHTLHQN